MTIITAAGTKNKANEERETPGFGRFPCERARAPRARRYILFFIPLAALSEDWRPS